MARGRQSDKMKTTPAIPATHAVLTVAEMYAADKAAAAAGIATLDLMEAAGRGIADVIRARWLRQAIAVLCGPGNNGGDGFVVARLLAEEGWHIRLALLGPESELRGDAAVNAKSWREAGRKIEPLSPALLDGAPLVVDALFGAGLSRELSGAARDVVQRINTEHLTCIAVDVPSGVSGDTGEILGDAPQCAATVTFFRKKPAHLLYPARALCGDITVVDIGIPPDVLRGIAPRTAHNEPGLWTLRTPHWNDNKYARGSAIVVGGGEITGAARLAARAARRAGAGLLTLAVPSAAVPIYAASEPGCFVQPLDTAADLDHVLADPRRNGVLIGPGAGVGMATCVNTLRILGTEKAVVLDADALTSFRDDPAQLFTAIKRRQRAEGAQTKNPTPTILTPHEGEFARLFKVTGSKLARARSAAAECGAVVVLKGSDTVIASPDGWAAISDNAPAWLATGGTGDVLAGIALGLLVQGLPAWEAACAAAWLLGAAGGYLGPGLIAEDLPEALPKVLKSL